MICICQSIRIKINMEYRICYIYYIKYLATYSICQDDMAIMTYGDYLNFIMIENNTAYNAADNFIHTVSKQPKLCLLYGWNGIIATKGFQIFTWDDNIMRYVH